MCVVDVDIESRLPKRGCCKILIIVLSLVASHRFEMTAICLSSSGLNNLKSRNQKRFVSI
jgi:hypothetical protein